MRRPTRPPTTDATRRLWLPAGVVLAALALTAPAAADPNDRAELQPGGPTQPALTRDQQVRAGAATLFLSGFPGGGEVYTELADLSAGEEVARVWTFYDPNVVRKIPQGDLDEIHDKTPIPKDVGDREQPAYFDMLIDANRTAPDALDKAAVRGEDGQDLWRKLFADPAEYRGQVVHFDGRLKKLRRFEPQAMAVQGGAKDYYEGFMTVDPWENDPVFIVLTELPEGLAPADKMDVPVGFSGYFYKIFRYTAADTKETHKDRLAPLVIGHTLALLGPAAPAAATEPEGEWPTWLGPLFFAVIGLTVGLLFTLGYWFRSGDRHVRVRVFAARHGEFVPPPPDAPPDPRAETAGGKPGGPGDLPPQP